MFLGEPGRTSVGSFYEILMEGRKFAEGAAKIVWIELASGRPVPLPERVIAPLRALESAAHGRRRLNRSASSLIMSTSTSSLAAESRAHRRGEHHGVRAARGGSLGHGHLPTTRRCGGGRTTSASHSGGPSGISAASSASAARARSSTRRKCPARDGFRTPASISPRTCSRAISRPVRPMRSCSAARTRARAAFPMPSSSAATSRVAAALKAHGIAAGDRRRRLHSQHARGHRRDAGRRLASARCGRRARPISACAACSTASGRSSRACSSPSMATGTTARRFRSWTRSPRSSPRCPRSSASS